MKQVFAYLTGTIDVSIVYRKSEDGGTITGYSDADYASDLETRRSTTGNIFCLSSGPVAWSSQRQRLVTLSTTESEYVAAATAAKELCRLRKLMCDIGGLYDESCTTLFVDNQSAIKLAKNPEFHNTTKHIYIRYHYLN